MGGEASCPCSRGSACSARASRSAGGRSSSMRRRDSTATAARRTLERERAAHAETRRAPAGSLRHGCSRPSRSSRTSRRSTARVEELEDESTGSCGARAGHAMTLERRGRIRALAQLARHCAAAIGKARASRALAAVRVEAEAREAAQQRRPRRAHVDPRQRDHRVRVRAIAGDEVARRARRRCRPPPSRTRRRSPPSRRASDPRSSPRPPRARCAAASPSRRCSCRSAAARDPSPGTTRARSGPCVESLDRAVGEARVRVQRRALRRAGGSRRGRRGCRRRA